LNYPPSLAVALIAEQVETLIVVDLIPKRTDPEELIAWWDNAVASTAVII
jgi:hypothetical protein